jgi:hypothetical protein
VSTRTGPPPPLECPYGRLVETIMPLSDFMSENDTGRRGRRDFSAFARRQELHRYFTRSRVDFLKNSDYNVKLSGRYYGGSVGHNHRSGSRCDAPRRIGLFGERRVRYLDCDGERRATSLHSTCFRHKHRVQLLRRRPSRRTTSALTNTGTPLPSWQVPSRISQWSSVRWAVGR